MTRSAGSFGGNFRFRGRGGFGNRGMISGSNTVPLGAGRRTTRRTMTRDIKEQNNKRKDGERIKFDRKNTIIDGKLESSSDSGMGFLK
ncbi:hypothetical protein NC651_033965 [Populus alba x Populus x berolinensis]|nr:hypothetical protein NC651_033965 [Populus alba x Populus x berolinensis]